MLTPGKQIVQTYKSLGHWHSFQVKLFAEGILVGIFAGLMISLFRFLLNEAETGREILYQRIAAGGSFLIGIWFLILLVLALILTWLTHHEPMASGSGIPQVKAVILGLMKMRWLVPRPLAGLWKAERGGRSAEQRRPSDLSPLCRTTFRIKSRPPRALSVAGSKRHSETKAPVAPCARTLPALLPSSWLIRTTSSPASLR